MLLPLPPRSKSKTKRKREKRIRKRKTRVLHKSVKSKMLRNWKNLERQSLSQMSLPTWLKSMFNSWTTKPQETIYLVRNNCKKRLINMEKELHTTSLWALQRTMKGSRLKSLRFTPIEPWLSTCSINKKMHLNALTMSSRILIQTTSKLLWDEQFPSGLS